MSMIGPGAMSCDWPVDISCDRRGGIACDFLKKGYYLCKTIGSDGNCVLLAKKLFLVTGEQARSLPVTSEASIACN